MERNQNIFRDINYVYWKAHLYKNTKKEMKTGIPSNFTL